MPKRKKSSSRAGGRPSSKKVREEPKELSFEALKKIARECGEEALAGASSRGGSAPDYLKDALNSVINDFLSSSRPVFALLDQLGPEEFEQKRKKFRQQETARLEDERNEWEGILNQLETGDLKQLKLPEMKFSSATGEPTFLNEDERDDLDLHLRGGGDRFHKTESDMLVLQVDKLNSTLREVSQYRRMSEQVFSDASLRYQATMMSTYPGASNPAELVRRAAAGK